MRDNICIYCSPEDRARLERLVADRNAPRKVVWRAEIVLATAEGLGTMAVMLRTGKPPEGFEPLRGVVGNQEGGQVVSKLIVASHEIHQRLPRDLVDAQRLDINSTIEFSIHGHASYLRQETKEKVPGLMADRKILSM